MSNIQEQLLELSRTTDLSRIPLRKIAELIKRPEISPSLVQHHLNRLEKRGLLFIDRKQKTQRHGERHLSVNVLPDGREIAYIPFKHFKVIDVDGCKAVIEIMQPKLNRSKNTPKPNVESEESL